MRNGVHDKYVNCHMTEKQNNSYHHPNQHTVELCYYITFSRAGGGGGDLRDDVRSQGDTKLCGL